MTFTTSDNLIANIAFNSDLTYGSVTDIEANSYKTIQFGADIWMAENLSVTKFNDSTPLLKLPPKDNSSTSECGNSWYNTDSATYRNVYGALYNWKVIDTGTNGSKNICPIGWHVPDDGDWNNLATYLGGILGARGKMKETGMSHWNSPNANATNISGLYF